jgi:CTP:molybdopterin cytidylyltransferase MocA
VSETLVALILAAGASSRMGTPKALLPLGGRSLLAHSLACVLAGGCTHALVVVGAHALTGEPALADPRVGVVVNTSWSLGPLSSLQAGLRAALEQHEQLAGVLVQRVEQPRVSPRTVAALLHALAEQPHAIVQPQVRGVSGHPIAWPRACFDDLLALDPRHASARTLLAQPEHAARRRKLALDDEGVLDNIDTPADYANLCATWTSSARDES